MTPDDLPAALRASVDQLVVRLAGMDLSPDEKGALLAVWAAGLRARFVELSPHAEPDQLTHAALAVAAIASERLQQADATGQGGHA